MVTTRIKNYIQRQKIKKSFASHEGSGENILLIEENDGLREMLNLALTTYGYNVMYTKNIAEAAEILEYQDISFNLIFCDIKIRAQDSLKILMFLQELSSRLPVLLTCGYFYQGNLKNYNGITSLITPYTVNELLSTIESLLKKNKKFILRN